MNIVVIVSVALLFIFSFVVLFGAPFVPTLKKRAEDAFELLDLKSGETLLELGSGDGRILRLAAKKGIKGIGYELNPLLVWYSRLRNWRYRKLISFKCRNFWHVELPESDAIYTFLLDKYMDKLDKKIIQEKQKSVKLVSFAFKIPNKKIIKEKNALFLYEYE